MATEVDGEAHVPPSAKSLAARAAIMLCVKDIGRLLLRCADRPGLVARKHVPGFRRRQHHLAGSTLDAQTAERSCKA